MRPTKDTALLQINNALVLLYFILITNSLIAPIIFDYDQEAVENSSVLKVAKYLPVAIYVLINSNNNNTNKFFSTIIDKLFLALSILYFVSVVWSPAKSSTFLNSVQFAIFIWFCNAILGQGKVDVFKVLMQFLVVVITTSWVMFVIFPEKGRMDGFHDGLARGVFMHKNVLGSTLVLLFPILMRGDILSVKRIVAILACASLIFFTGSATSIITVLIIILLIPFIKSFKGNTLVTFITSAFGSIAIISYQYSELIFNAFGKSEDLTGRAVLWSSLLEAIDVHPYLGWGYFGFWESKAKENFLGQMEWITGKSHNAFIDVILSGGYVLLALVIVILYIILKNSLYCKDNDLRIYCLLSFFSIMVLSLTEINLFSHNNIYLFIIIFISKLVSIKVSNIKERNTIHSRKEKSMHHQLL